MKLLKLLLLLLLCATPMSPCIQDHLVWFQYKDREQQVSCTEEVKSLCCCCEAFLEPVLQSVWAAPQLWQTGFTDYYYYYYYYRTSV